MIYNKGKISIKYALILFLSTILIPEIRVGLKFSTYYAKQAVLLTMIFSLIGFYIIVIVLNTIVSAFPGKSLMDIICSVFGNFLGKIILIIYMLWTNVLVALYIRYYSERGMYISTPNTKEYIYIILMLVLVAYIIRSDLVVLSRISTLVFYSLFAMLFISIIFALQNVNWNYLMPFAYNDILPSMFGSVGRIALSSYVTYLLFFGDRINNMEKFKGYCLKFALPLGGVISLINIIITVGTIGHTIVNRSSTPFFLASKQINIFETFGRLEALFVAVSVLGDFVIIAFFTLVILYIFRYLFNLKDYKNYINIYLIFIFIFSYFLMNNFFQLEKFSFKIGIWLIFVFSYIIPIFILLIGKLRKKI